MSKLSSLFFYVLGICFVKKMSFTRTNICEMLNELNIKDDGVKKW